MLSPWVAKRIREIETYSSQGALSPEEIVDELATLVTPQNYAEIVKQLPSAWSDQVKQAIAVQTQKIADANSLQPESSPFVALQPIGWYYERIDSMLVAHFYGRVRGGMVWRLFWSAGNIQVGSE